MICKTIFQGKKGNGNLLLRDIQGKRRAFIALKLKHHDLIHRCFWNIFKQNWIMYSPNFLSQIRSDFWNKFKGNYNSVDFLLNMLHRSILTIWVSIFLWISFMPDFKNLAHTDVSLVCVASPQTPCSRNSVNSNLHP